MALEVDVKKDLGAFKLNVRFSLERDDEVLALLGPSGCGKSLTLGCIAGTLRPDEGRIVLNGRVLFDSKAHVNLPPQERRVGYLFQNYALFPTMTVEQNVMAGARGNRRERREKAARYLRLMQLEGLERHKPAQLSGGQQQRCALARMFANEPDLVLLDEPFSALDEHLRWTLEMGLSDTLKRFSGGAVYVSHSRDEVYRLCDRVCVIDRGSSEEPVPTKAFFENSHTVAAAKISGCKNISPARLLPDGRLWCDDWGVALATTLPVPAGVSAVGIRAHYLHPGQGENAIPCSVDRVIDNLFSTVVMLKTPGGGLLRYELDKDAWASMERAGFDAVVIDPCGVMPLV